MSGFNSAIVLKIISSIFFLGSGLIWKKLLCTDVKNYNFIFFRVVASLFFLFLLLLLYKLTGNPGFSFSLRDTTWKDWIICLSICFFSFWGLYFYTDAMQNGRFSFVTPLLVISSVFSFFVSMLLYGENLNGSKCLALVLIILGLFFHQKDKLIDFKFSKEVLLVVLCGFFWGISFVLYLIPIKKFGVLSFSIILEFCVLASCIILLIIKDKRVVPRKVSRQSFLLCMCMGLLVAAGSYLSNFSLTQLPVSLNIILGSLFEILIIAAGIFLFREKLEKKDWVLIVLASAGGFLFLF